jgi:hypothetical protein
VTARAYIKLVATVNRFVIDRGLSHETTTHGQESADRGYPLLSFGLVALYSGVLL